MQYTVFHQKNPQTLGIHYHSFFHWGEQRNNTVLLHLLKAFLIGWATYMSGRQVKIEYLNIQWVYVQNCAYCLFRKHFGKEQKAVVYAFLPPRNYPETFNVQKKQKKPWRMLTEWKNNLQFWKMRQNLWILISDLIFASELNTMLWVTEFGQISNLCNFYFF